MNTAYDDNLNACIERDTAAMLLAIAQVHFPAAVRIEQEGDGTIEAYRQDSGRDVDPSDAYLGYVLIEDGLLIEVADAAFTHYVDGGDDLRYDGQHIIR